VGAGPDTFPHNLEAERAIIGAVLVDNGSLAAAAALVTDQTFYRDAHQRIWRSITTLAASQTAIDLITLKAELERVGDLDEVNGPAYLASLIDGVPRSINVGHYAQIIKDHAARRALIASCDRFRKAAYAAEESPEVLAAELVADVDTTRRHITMARAGAAALFVSARETCAAQESVPDLLPPYLKTGSLLSLIGKIKAGKTSLILEQVRCLRRGEGFCGYPAPELICRVLYATEQPQASFAKQLRDHGLHEDEGVLVTYLSAWRGRSWEAIAPALIDHAINQGVSVMVIDTASRWFGFKGDQENQSGGAEHVDLLQPFCAIGGTVILSRHGRKSGGTATDAGRGTTAIEGAVDTILHLTLPSGHGPDVRALEAVGRFDLPERVLVRRVETSTSPPSSVRAGEHVPPRYRFQRCQAEADSVEARISAELQRGKRSKAELAKCLGVGRTTIDRALQNLKEQVIEVGKGGAKNNATLYGLKSEKGTSPSQSLRDGHVQVADRRTVQ
jgi:DnaB-like helicase N terminal domain/AAA domain